MFTAHILIRGHVQGIGFRRFCTYAAEDCGVTGTVENLSDGDVLAIAVGEKDALESFIERVKKGNGFSIIERVDVKWKEGGTPGEDMRIVKATLW
jgi:acylphosphatase